MWHYAGPSDSTRSHPECVSGETVRAWDRGITGASDNPEGARRMKPFRVDNPPPNEEWTNWYSAVSNGNPAEEEEGSQEGAEYVSGSGETEEETEEEEEEDGEQSSPPSPPEHRTKRRHDHAAPPAPPTDPSASPAPPVAPSAPPAPPVAPSAPPAPPVAQSARSVKMTRDAAAEPVNQPSKVAKPSGPKPRKPLPRMRIVVPVASA
uniref:Uncharacterized protein n=1 Tax=Hordeum vulgare subsp. vulgare TaxID=112509 RepID=A0A8I6YJ61_HORVV